jgi:N-carbamoyl-L-amino-acid hydrolase
MTSDTRTSTRSAVDGARLLGDLDALSRIGGTVAGGVSRPAYGDADIEARRVVRDMMKDAGLAVRVDTGGNTFGSMPGTMDAPPIVIGSHTDTVPDGGRFDGALGVLAAIEVARTLRDSGEMLRHPLEVVDFQNEEGGLVGSKIVSGRFTSDALSLVATSGRTIGDGIRLLGGAPEHLARALRQPGTIAAYVELHIEQGMMIERAGARIGVVEGLVAIRYWDVTFEGVASHAGTTAMTDRRDALLAAARFVDAVNTAVTSTPGRHVGTVGKLAVFPGGANVIPGKVVLTLELRDQSEDVIESLFERIEREAKRVANGTGTRVTMIPTLRNSPSPTDPRVRDAITHAARALGLKTHAMVSGAGHDAQNMAAIGPAGMIFVPSVGGISHSPAERTDDEDVVNGADLLLGTVLRLDGTV